MSLARARHRIARLRRMDSPELGHRVREVVRVGVDRLSGALGRERLDPALDAAGADAADFLREVAAERFYGFATGDDARTFHDALQRPAAGAVERLVDDAEASLAGRVELPGRGSVAAGADVDWHRDPVTGARWPVRFWSDYDLVAADNPGDPKNVHELNRHQHLPRLALACWLTGRRELGHHALEQMEHWLDHNPPGMGVNWACSLEVGLRALSWMWTLLPLARAGALEDAPVDRLVGGLRAHLEHVARYPSVYSSPNTHLLGEALALFAGGVLLAEMHRADEWLDAGIRHLVREADRQILADGMHAELSTYYHCYTLDFYLQALALADRNGIELPASLRDRVGALATVVRDLTRVDGTLPLLGDDDGGRALALHGRHYGSYRDGLATAAVLLERPDLAHAAGGPSPESIWLLGPAAATRLDELAQAAGVGAGESEGRSPSPAGPGGYHVQRAGAARLVFDCGDLGRLGGGHGHADALAVTLHTGGVEMLADPGTSLYNLAPEWRDHFRSTAAHNTVTVDDLSQAEPGDVFRWSTRLQARLLAAHDWPGLELLEGEHRGYLRLERPLTHRRIVLLVDRSYWLVVDDLRGAGSHRYELGYQLAPETDAGDVEPEAVAPALWHAGVAAGGDRLGLWVGTSRPCRADVHRGAENPPRGWVSRVYGERVPAPNLRFVAEGPAPTTFVSVLFPEPDGVEVTVPEGDASEGVVALSIHHPGGDDIVVANPAGAQVRTGTLTGDARFVWLGRRNDAPRRVLYADATELDHEDRRLLAGPTPEGWRTIILDAPGGN